MKQTLIMGFSVPRRWTQNAGIECLHNSRGCNAWQSLQTQSARSGVPPVFLFSFFFQKIYISLSPTAESFGVSAQIGSGVVRGDPELRFHQGSTRVPPGFHQGSTRGFHQGSTRVPPDFHQVLQGRGGLGWFEVRFHEGSTRVPPISSRAAGLRKVSRGFRQGSTRVPGCGVVWVVCGKVPRGLHQACRVVRGGLR